MLTIKTTPEGVLPPAQRRAGERPPHDDRALGASRRVPDRRHRHRRSRVSHRTSRAQPVWALDPGQTMGSNWCECAAELPLGGGRAALPPRHEPVLKSSRPGTALPTKPARRRRDDVSRILIEAAANVVDARSVRPLLSVFQRRRRMRVEIVRSPAPGSRRSRLRCAPPAFARKRRSWPCCRCRELSR